MQKNKTLSLNKKNDNDKKTSEDTIKSHQSLIDILNEIFQERINKNKEAMSASLTKNTQKDIINLCGEEKIISKDLDKLIPLVKISDPEFKVITDISILAIDRKSKMNETIRSSLMRFCTLAISRCSILESLSTDDIYKDLLGIERNCLSKLITEVKNKYKKRMDGLDSIQKKQDTDGMSNSVELNKKNKLKLEFQRENVILVGVIYGLFHSEKENNIDHKDAIKYIQDEFYKHDSVEEVDIFLYLIKNRKKPEIKKVLFFFQQQINSNEKKYMESQNKLNIKIDEYSKCQEGLAKQKEDLSKLTNKNSDQASIIQGLKNCNKELVQDEKAKRVHLHDDTKRAKAKAINLLEEDVLESIKLCLSALRRDNPKVNIATQHLEIIEESIEKGLKWFKK